LKLLVSWALLLLSDGREGDWDVTLLRAVDGKKGEEICDVRGKEGTELPRYKELRTYELLLGIHVTRDKTYAL
jgi:hypothetical protein